MRVAVESGWVRARNTCLAADAVSLLAAVVLYIFAVGVVKGFAFAPRPLHPDRPRGVLLVHPADGVLAGPVPFFNKGHKLSGLDAESLGIDATVPWEGGPDGQVLASRQRPLQRQEVDRLRRPAAGSGTASRRSSSRSASSVSGVKGLNFGIEFTGGAEYRVTLPAEQVTQDTADELREAVAGPGIDDASAPVVTTSGTEAVLVQTEPLTDAESAQVVEVILETTGAEADDLSQSEIGAELG